MTVKNLKILIIFLTTAIIVSCTKEYDCGDYAIAPAFIGFAQTDIDIFVIRKFKSNDNYQNLIDTFVIRYGESSAYQVKNDTSIVSVFLPDVNNMDKAGIKVGYDWQIFIPSKNKVISLSDIISEKKKGKRSYGILASDSGPSCFNRIIQQKPTVSLLIFLTHHILLFTFTIKRGMQPTKVFAKAWQHSPFRLLSGLRSLGSGWLSA